MYVPTCTPNPSIHPSIQPFPAISFFSSPKLNGSEPVIHTIGISFLISPLLPEVQLVNEKLRHWTLGLENKLVRDAFWIDSFLAAHCRARRGLRRAAAAAAGTYFFPRLATNPPKRD